MLVREGTVVTRQDARGLSGAVYSPCERYRYRLWRKWDDGDGMVAFVGLNPSVATEVMSDPTVTRCIKYAQRWGCAGMYMLNVFALRSTDPRLLYQVKDPIGPGNDEHILQVCRQSAKIIAAWGTHGAHLQRSERMCELLRDLPVWCLGTTQHGFPRHPLYLRADAQPQRYPTTVA